MPDPKVIKLRVTDKLMVPGSNLFLHSLRVEAAARIRVGHLDSSILSHSTRFNFGIVIHVPCHYVIFMYDI